MTAASLLIGLVKCWWLYIAHEEGRKYCSKNTIDSGLTFCDTTFPL